MEIPAQIFSAMAKVKLLLTQDTQQMHTEVAEMVLYINDSCSCL